MKVVVSIPDEICAETESLAKRLKTSRSEMFTRALREFIEHHAPDCVSELMNDVVREVGQQPDAFTVAASRGLLKKSEMVISQAKVGGKPSVDADHKG